MPKAFVTNHSLKYSNETEIKASYRKLSMKKELYTFLSVLLLTCSASILASQKRSFSSSTCEITGLIAQHTKKAQIGAKVVSLQSSSTLYAHNPLTVHIPASNTKLFTAGAALHILGPSFRYETQFCTDQSLGVSRIGNLYIKGSGDPTLLSKDLERMVLTLRAKGIREIKGSIIVDSSVFDDQSSAPGWAEGDGPIFDKSQLRGLLVDHSCISITVKPAHALHRRPCVQVYPSTHFLALDNQALTLASPTKQGIATNVTGNNKLRITGKIALKSAQKLYRIALQNPDIFAGQVVHTLLKKHGISNRGTVRKGTTPLKGAVLTRHYSKPAHMLIKTMMRKSDNLYADALFKTMGAHFYGVPGTWAKGKKAMDNFLTKTMKLTPRFSINDGSGLSRTNKISATCVVDFLIAMYKTPFKDHFIATFPVAGTNGSLRNRLTDKTTVGIVKAKTGSLAGVSSLSGYIFPPSGKNLAFSLLTNKQKGSALPFKKTFEDPLCTLLIKKHTR